MLIKIENLSCYPKLFIANCFGSSFGFHHEDIQLEVEVLRFVDGVPFLDDVDIVILGCQCVLENRTSKLEILD